MKWRDERTENRREVNYVIREAGEDAALCLLVDGPLRIGGEPDLVSVQFVGRTILRAETVWEVAVTTWANGAVDDEGLVRLCSPDVFRGQGDYLRRDLKRMVREYRQGVRGCHDLVPSPTGEVRAEPALSVAHVGKRLDVLQETLQQVAAAASKRGTAESLSVNTLRREIVAPMVMVMQALEKKVIEEFDDRAPQNTEERIQAVVAYIKKTVGVSEIERKAAILAMSGISYAEIALRLPHKAGKPMSREGVRKALLRFERKARLPGMFAKGSYRQHVAIEAEARRAAESDAQDADEERDS